MDENYYTVEEVARRLKVSKGAVYQWMRAGLLGYVIVGTHRRIPESALRAFIRPVPPGDAPPLYHTEESDQETEPCAPLRAA